MSKKYFTITYGCQMNIFDTGVIESIMESINYKEAKDIYNADVIFVNGCSVREHAFARAIGFVNSIKNSVKENAKIYITGCLANSVKDNIPDFINGLIGTVYYSEIPEIIRMDNFVDMRGIEKENDYTIYKIKNNVTLYISIIKGCNNLCSYCIVPYLRGKEISFSPDSIIRQIEMSITKQTGEIFLLGQNVNSYFYKGIDFKKLLKMVAEHFDNKRIRFLTSHPKDYNEDLIKIIADHDNLCNSIHLPFQSGSNRILKIMHRDYTIEDYLEKIILTRKMLKNVVITSDIMVGFPYETQEDFNNTIDVVKKVKFDDAFMYKYSKRNFTLSEYFEDMDDKIKLKRLKLLINLQNSIKINKLGTLIGSEQNILIERISKKNKNDFIGKDEGTRSVIVKGKCEIGKTYRVIIEKISGVTPIGVKKEE